MKVYPVLLFFTAFLMASCVESEKEPAREEPKEATFANPIAPGADPWVIEKDGIYYSCGSAEGGIYVAATESMTDLGGRQMVWQTPNSGWNQDNVWAPELHFLNGRWYIYYAAAQQPGAPFIYQRSGVLESVSDDPFGPYEDAGMLYTGDDIADPASVKWAIDLTPLEHEGNLYAIWSGWEENQDTDKTPQHLYIASMSDPKTISGNRVRISSPEETWETGGELDLNEGPQILKKDDEVFLIYSTRESWLKEYRLGQLRLQNKDAPMETESWEKSGPVFQGTAQVHGVGHCSFVKSPDGTEDWIYYHAKKTTEPGWDRDIRLQPFTWHANGSPDFGAPVPAGVPLRLPSGQE